MIIGICSLTLSVQANIQIKLFVSASMGKALLGDLLKNAENEVLVVRGINAHQQNLTTAFQQWQRRLKQNSSSTSVEIDPIAFRQDQINRVPALSLQIDGKTELTAFGVTSTGWLKRQYQAGKRGNLGTFGTTYPVVEPDLLEVLFQRLHQINWQTVQATAYKRLQGKTFSFGAKLPTSQQASTKVLSISGNWHIPLIALDVNDRQQQKAVLPWLQQYPDALVLVSSGSLKQLQGLPSLWHQHSIYIMPPELIRRFQLTSLYPSPLKIVDF